MYWGTIADCPLEEGCLEWVHRYLKDCVCSFRDEVSLTLGLISVLSWGVAEVPQIITNFREKSTEGVSVAFLMTWVVGDVFNLAGCYLEPATLPTQFYMAVLYTFTTLILLIQTLYYSHFYKWYNRKMGYVEAPEENKKLQVEPTKPVQPSGIPEGPKVTGEGSPGAAPISVGVPLTRRTSLRASDLYYTSARSLASSHTPGIGSYMRESASPGHHGVLRSSVASPHQHGSLLRTAAGSILLVGTVGLTTTMLGGGINTVSRGEYPAVQFLVTGRRLLQHISIPTSRGSFAFLRARFLGEAGGEGPLGEIFGWCMAAIYMGGRLPQILLNIKRGTVEGLNPLMFVFALVGNATYVASILVRSVLWTDIKPNLPWLVDAAVCVLLDLFILCQFIYYNIEVMEDEKERREREYEAQKDQEKGVEKR
ncbi:hypothetical protein R1sor_018149 [Riccia sorocarpa]|uniref:Vacuolar amino acid transporter YPQ1 n=1 Tax=Riccia sorocarpa TaxID=122646 RepID=A0ABD3I908_9MARC